MNDDPRTPVALTRRELRGRMTRANRRAIAKSVRPKGRRPRRSLAAKAASVGALLFAGTLVIAVSVPANLFLTDAAAVSSRQPVATVEGQTLTVSADAQAATPERDGYDALTYAEALALKYAGTGYGYAATSGAVRWPFPYAVPVTDGFGPRDGGFHKGTDFVPGVGTPIYAIADGVATTSTLDNSGYGQHVVLQHSLSGVNVKTLYAHMIEGSSPIVAGQQVKVGDFLGLVGETGLAFGAHLHFELYVDNTPIDAFAWLQANAVN